MIVSFEAFLVENDAAQNIRVKGPGIDVLARAARDMYRRGAPTEKNDYGFNGQHYTNIESILSHPDFTHEHGMPLEMAVYLLRSLSVYKNTQLPSMGIEYPVLTQMVYADIETAKKAAGIVAPTQSAAVVAAKSSNKAILYPKETQYGKTKLHLPAPPDRSMMIGLNKIIKNHLGDNVEYQVNDYGQRVPVLWKHLSKDKHDVSVIWLHRDLIHDVAKWLKETKKIDMVYDDGRPVDTTGQAAPPEQKQKEQPPEEKQRPKVTVLGKERLYGKDKLIADIPYDGGFKYADARAAGLAPHSIGLTKDLKGGSGKFYKGWVYIIDASHDNQSRNFKDAHNLLSQRGYDTQDLLSAMVEKTADTLSKLNTAADKIAIKFRDPDPKSNEMAIRVPFQQMDVKERQVIKDTLKYLFPGHTWAGEPAWEYTVKGNFTQYIHLGQILQKPPYNFQKDGATVASLREIVQNKVKNGGLDSSHVEGRVPKGFEDAIEKNLPESKFDLYDAQKDGVAFLYSRKHAILGDETGLGKTVQLISAAALKMQQSGKSCLIIALKAIQDQWVQSIKDVVGPTAKVSTDPLHPSQWTVLYYENFASKATKKKTADGREQTVDNGLEAGSASLKNALIKAGIAKANSKGTYYVGDMPLNTMKKEDMKLLLPDLGKVTDVLKEHPFEIVIFDELHKVKHDTTKRWANIEAVTQPIPVKWGATATISSNKPIDVRNQLKILGHYLGEMSVGRFKRDFAGMQPQGYKGAYIDGSLDDKLIAAEKLNRWLNMTGLYVRRKKSDIRDMPNLEVKDNNVQGLPYPEFLKMYHDKMKEYRNQDLAISQLIAARNVIAVQKTNATTRKVVDIVQSGVGKPSAASKTVVFTNFIESGRELYQKISNELKQIDPKYTALTYTSDTGRGARSQVKDRFTNDPNVKVLIMSMKMGGTGIDFPNAAQNMVINDYDWTPESAEQSEGRIYRINTNHPVNITYMVAEGFDKALYDKVQEKRAVATIIQQHRKVYEETGDDAALNKIVAAQKRNEQLNKDIEATIHQAIGGPQHESFQQFLSRVA